MFQRLEREHGVTHYLAHNMTVTPANIGQAAQVIRDCRDMGFRMFSFQPAAFIGNTEPLEARLPRVLHRRGVAPGRGGRRRAAALERVPDRRPSLQPHGLRRLLR